MDKSKLEVIAGKTTTGAWSLEKVREASANDLLSGYPHLGIPHFQRGFVWGNDATALLLESLYLGTPCGTIILWQPSDCQEEGVLLPGADTPRYLILDGQQRIRSLYAALKLDIANGGELEDPTESARAPHGWCINLAHTHAKLPEDLSKVLRRNPRLSSTSLFCFIQMPDTERAPLKSNVVPLQWLLKDTEDMDERIIGVVQTDPDDPDLRGKLSEHVMVSVRERVREMVGRKDIFHVRTLKQENGRFNLAEVVSLYNRINSSGKRVEAEEKAFASLVAIAPGTETWLSEVFAAIHRKDSCDAEADRDDVLQRMKERSFGFKLIIRTFIQVCAYHLGEPGRNALSFDLVDRPTFRAKIAGSGDRAARLRKTTKDVLCFLRSVLREELCCDDLQMLPEITALLPVFQFLIRFPATMDLPEGRNVVACIILRFLLHRGFTQRDILGLVELVNKCQSADDCIGQLVGAGGNLGSAVNSKQLLDRLEWSNSLQDPCTLLLYWLIRRNRATDFSYEALHEKFPKRRERMLTMGRHGEYDNPVRIQESAGPEKQHIVPYNLLSKLYKIEARGRISRHIANNIGNITYISRALNHYETGWGEACADLRRESEENMNAHCLGADLRDEFQRISKVLNSANANLNASRERFEKLCAKRRRRIADGFLSWCEKLRLAAVIHQRVEPAPRLLRLQEEDHVREIGFSDEVEDALIACVEANRVQFDDKETMKQRLSTQQRVLKLVDDKRRLMGRLFLCAQPKQVEIVLAGKRYPPLSDDPENAQTTADILQYLAKFLSGRLSEDAMRERMPAEQPKDPTPTTRKSPTREEFLQGCTAIGQESFREILGWWQTNVVEKGAGDVWAGMKSRTLRIKWHGRWVGTVYLVARGWSDDTTAPDKLEFFLGYFRKEVADVYREKIDNSGLPVRWAPKTARMVLDQPLGDRWHALEGLLKWLASLAHGGDDSSASPPETL